MWCLAVLMPFAANLLGCSGAGARRGDSPGSPASEVDGASSGDTGDTGDTGAATWVPPVFPDTCTSTTFESAPYDPSRVSVEVLWGFSSAEPDAWPEWSFDAYGHPVVYWGVYSYAQWVFDAEGRLSSYRLSDDQYEWDEPSEFTLAREGDLIVSEERSCFYKGGWTGGSTLSYHYDVSGRLVHEVGDTHSGSCGTSHYIDHFQVPEEPAIVVGVPTPSTGHVTATYYTWSVDGRSAVYEGVLDDCGRLDFDAEGRLVGRIDDQTWGDQAGGCDGIPTTIWSLTHDERGRLATVSRDGDLDRFGMADGLVDETCTHVWNECDRVAAYRCVGASGDLTAYTTFTYDDGVLLAEQADDINLDGVPEVVIAWTWSDIAPW